MIKEWGVLMGSIAGIAYIVSININNIATAVYTKLGALLNIPT